MIIITTLVCTCTCVCVCVCACVRALAHTCTGCVTGEGRLVSYFNVLSIWPILKN